MAHARAPSKQLLRSLQALAIDSNVASTRAFSTARSQREEVQVQRSEGTSFYSQPNPETVFVPRLERKLTKAGTPPVGSRRRRVALTETGNVPFDQLPFQCFQEARKILITDREEKMKKIETERARIARVKATDASEFRGGETFKQKKLKSMQLELEHLKILADINDPNVKRRFEDGKGMPNPPQSKAHLTTAGDMNKPIYRYLADQKWREYRRKVVMQRITQMNVVPDVLPHMDPVVDVKLAFDARSVQPGDFVDSAISAQSCRLNIQSFDRGEKLLTVAVVDSDVPNFATDSFDSRCHFLASNIPITPTTSSVNLGKLSLDSQIMLPWFPPYAQKGSPYHRLSVIVLQQRDNIPIDLGVAMKKVQRDGFTMRSFITRHMLTPIGATLFRTKWDENMAGVMAKAGVEGANVELKRVKVEPLPYQRRNPSTFR